MRGIRWMITGVLVVTGVLTIRPSTGEESDASYPSGDGASLVVVCSDGEAGGYEAFPDVARLAPSSGDDPMSGRLLCVFYAGYTHVSWPDPEKLPNGGRIVACWSDDDGQTWSAPRTIIDTPGDDRDPSVYVHTDGRILCNFFIHSGEQGPNSTYLTESTDGGETWSTPRMIYENLPCSTPIRRLSTGRLILGLYGPDPVSGVSSGAVGLSDDGGRTWSDVIFIPNGGRQLDAETDVIELKDGSLYALQRPWMGVSRSTDGGETWTTAEHVGFEGHCPYLMRTRDDVILLGTRLPKTTLRISRDECATWSEPIQVDAHSGAYPSMVELRDGSVLFVFYEEGSGSDIVARRFRIFPDSLEWK
ncbi:MAG: sialidase family protein [Planctomycetia bacterium]|nr:sialidase family protein [Planctomycetia bacterium]